MEATLSRTQSREICYSALLICSDNARLCLRRARSRWRRSPRVGGGSKEKPRAFRGFFHWLYIGRQTLAFWHHEGRTPTDGNAVTREAAMAALAKSWRRERLQIDVAWGAGESNLPIKTIQCI